jgi:hypothetical protein
MTNLEEMHAQNLSRFGSIETRLSVVESKMDAGIAIAKWIGGAVIAILSVLAAQVWMHP